MQLVEGSLPAANALPAGVPKRGVPGDPLPSGTVAGAPITGSISVSIDAAEPTAPCVPSADEDTPAVEPAVALEGMPSTVGVLGSVLSAAGFGALCCMDVTLACESELSISLGSALEP